MSLKVRTSYKGLLEIQDESGLQGGGPSPVRPGHGGWAQGRDQTSSILRLGG